MKPITAQYNHGIIEPVETLDLYEGEQIKVIIRRETNGHKMSRLRTNKKHSFELLRRLKFKSGLPDASVNLDKYIYDNPHCS